MDKRMCFVRVCFPDVCPSYFGVMHHVCDCV